MTDIDTAPTDVEHSNSLADLAARINAEHKAAADALRSAVGHAMAAGDLLIEAKAKVPHGQWRGWIDANCQISERSVQLYMKLAKHREVIEMEKQIRNGRCGFDSGTRPRRFASWPVASKGSWISAPRAAIPSS